MNGLSKYDDTDIFVMSEAEHLVPYLKKVVDPISGEDAWSADDPIFASISYGMSNKSLLQETAADYDAFFGK